MFGDVMAVFGDVMAVFGDVDTVMDHATPQIATRRNQRDSSKCRRLALGT